MGNRDKHLLTQLDTIAKGLSETLAPFCEVVVHDLTNPEHAILSIHNNLSGRKVGDPATELGLARIMSPEFPNLITTMLTSLQMVALQKAPRSALKMKRAST